MPFLGHYIFIYIILSGNTPSVQRFTEGPYHQQVLTQPGSFTEVLAICDHTSEYSLGSLTLYYGYP